MEMGLTIIVEGGGEGYNHVGNLSSNINSLEK